MKISSKVIHLNVKITKAHIGRQREEKVDITRLDRTFGEISSLEEETTKKDSTRVGIAIFLVASYRPATADLSSKRSYSFTFNIDGWVFGLTSRQRSVY